MAQNSKNYKFILLFLIVLLIVICIIYVLLNNNTKSNENNTKQAIISSKLEKNIQKNDEHIVKYLQGLGERDRMEYYFGIFLGYVENEQYEDAYKLLYDEFKKNYFPTLASFREYTKKTFPEFASVKHENIERNGDVYVLWITITDTINFGEGKKINVVLHEKDYNDFVLSFSVI